MKKIFILISLLLCFSLLTGCINITLKSPDESTNIENDTDKQEEKENEDLTQENVNDDNTNKDHDKEDDKDINKDDENEHIDKDDQDSQNTLKNDEKDDKDENISSNRTDARVGTVENPIKKGETGIIVVNNYTTNNPAKIYVTLKEIITGSEAEKLIKEYEQNSIFTFTQEESIEMRVAKFSIDLTDFETSTYGKRLNSILPFGTIMDAQGKAIKHNSMLYTLPLHSMGDPYDTQKNVLSGETADCYVIYSIPKNYSGVHIVEFDDKEHQNVYFKIQ